jgi:hypothetical protein
LFNVDVCALGTDVASGGAKAMATVLESNTTLTSIDLASNLLECFCGVHLHWEFVMLGNSIDDDGANSIAKALESNATLTLIDLGGKCFECAFVFTIG